MQRATLPRLIVALMIFGMPTLSDAYIDSVEPGDDDTSLIVTFTEEIEGSINLGGTITGNVVCQNSGEGTYLFEWREAQEDAEWQSATKTYAYTWGSCSSSNQTETFTIEGLEPGTTYEVRYNSGAIHQGTTGGGTAVEDVTWGSLKSKVTP